MSNNKIIRILKIILIISLLLFVIVVTKYKTNDCQLCSFDIDGQELRVGSFMDYYYFECLWSSNKPLIIDDIIQNGGINNE